MFAFCVKGWEAVDPCLGREEKTEKSFYPSTPKLQRHCSDLILRHNSLIISSRVPHSSNPTPPNSNIYNSSPLSTLYLVFSGLQSPHPHRPTVQMPSFHVSGWIQTTPILQKPCSSMGSPQRPISVPSPGAKNQTPFSESLKTLSFPQHSAFSIVGPVWFLGCLSAP